LEEEKIALVDELDAVFPSLSIENIARIPEAIDYFLIEALKRCVVKYSPQLFHADQADVDGSAVMIEGATIHIDNTHNYYSPKRDRSLLDRYFSGAHTLIVC